MKKIIYCCCLKIIKKLYIINKFLKIRYLMKTLFYEIIKKYNLKLLINI